MREFDRRHNRFIPTYMGNASWAFQNRSASAVHPHVHGERASLPSTSARLSVHPHVHGERVAPPAFSHPDGGSSPRTWGTRSGNQPPRSSDRFIPTYMGNATGEDLFGRRIPVHPHVHGERPGYPAGPRPPDGSSPRTWGTLPPDLYRG